MKGRGSWVQIDTCPLNQTRQKKTCLMMPISRPCQMVETIWSYHIPCSLWSPHLVSPPFRLSWLRPTPCPADTKLSRTHKSMKRHWILIPHRSTEWQPVDDDKHHCTMGMNMMGAPHKLRTETVLCYLEHNLLPKPHIPNDLQAVKADDAWDRLKTLQEVAYLLLQSRDQEPGV